MKYLNIILFFSIQLIACELDREKLLTLFSGEWISRALYTTAKLEIADKLDEPRTSLELSNLTKCHPESLDRLMTALSNFLVFEKLSDGRYINNHTSLLLKKNHPETLHGLCIFYGEDIHKAFDSFLSSIKIGKPAFELSFGEPIFQYFKNHPERLSLFKQGMKEKSLAVINSILDSYEFGNFTTLCDVGGGEGQFLKGLLKRHPHLKATLFELPEVANQPHDKTYQVISGNFFNSIPQGIDAYLLKSVLHDWDDEECKKILDNCFSAMSPNSKLLITEVVIDKEFPYASCMDMLMLTLTGGKERSLDTFKKMLYQSGFIIQNIYPTSTEFTLIEAKKSPTPLLSSSVDYALKN